ncbi:MAG: HNH endonuclease [Planctomycetes bacterium]|nr:HNH endonuclease [Planctomycetota bacterium]
MEQALEELVWERAGHRCEYCHMPEEFELTTFEIDHVIAISHGGLTRAANLCFACFSCNSFKGTNLAGIDPKTKKVVPLFNPRRHSWRRHFRWDGPVLIGRTPYGRATVATLRINLDHRVAYRQALIDEGVFPLD